MIFPGELVLLSSACGIFPLGLCWQAVALHIACLGAEPLEQIVGAPGAESIGLFPSDAHHGIVVVGSIGEIVAQIGLVLRIVEVVHPAGSVGIDVHNVGIEKIPRARERAVDGFLMDASFIVDVGRVFRNHDHLVGVHHNIGVQRPLLGVHAVAAQGSRSVVVDFVFIVQLAVVQEPFACDGVGHVEAFDGALLVFVWFAGQRFLPVYAGLHGIAILIFGNHVRLVAGILRIGQTSAENTVAYPHDKLAILRVGHFCFVHPESFYRDVLHRSFFAPEGVLLGESHTHITTVDAGHAERCRLVEGACAANANHFAASASH